MSKGRLRFVPKQLGRVWGAYDRERGSFPVERAPFGFVPQDIPTEDAAAQVCEALGNAFGKTY